MTWWMEERFKPEHKIGLLLDEYPETHTTLFFYMDRNLCETHREDSIKQLCERSMKVFTATLLSALNALTVNIAHGDPD